MTADQPESSQVLTRYVAILDVFAGLRPNGDGSRATHRGLGVAEVSAALGLSKGTISRYMRRLEDAGLVTRLPDRRYVLSSRIYHWGQAAAPGRDIRVRARPALEALADTFGEPASLFVLDNDAAMCIDQVEGRHPLRLNAAIGRRLPLHTGSSPRLLLAFASDEHQRRVFAQAPYAVLAPRTITSAEELARSLVEARRNGYVISDSEANVGVIGIATIIRDAAGAGCAAISIAGPKERMTGERQADVLTALQHAAGDVSRALGYLPVESVEVQEKDACLSIP
jgi:DNA-binding IclR family transcriptional regulator